MGQIFLAELTTTSKYPTALHLRTGVYYIDVMQMASITLGGIMRFRTKVIVPKKGALRMVRHNLKKRIAQGSTAQVVLLVAPQGYGKTTLLADIFESKSKNKQKAAWYTLGPEADDPMQFWAYLSDAINLAWPELSIYFSEESEDIDTFLADIVNAIELSEGDFNLVLDNFEYACSVELVRGLSLLIANIPSNLRIFLSSSSMPPLSLATIQSVAQVDLLDPSVLAFTPEECRDFFQAEDLFIEDSKARRIWEETQGWPALVHLACKSLETKTGSVSSGIVAHTGLSAAHEYLMETVIAPMDEELQDFLIQTSVLERLSSENCNYLLGETNSRDLLDKLFGKYYVISATDDSMTSYRHVPQMREALLAKLAKEDPKRLSALHERALSLCREKELHIESIHHLLALQRFEEAVEIIAEESSNLVGHLDYSAILDMLEQIPQGLLLSRSSLLSLYFALCFYTGQMERAAGVTNANENPFGFSIFDLGDFGKDSASDQPEERAVLASCLGVILRFESLDIESACEAIERHLRDAEVSDPIILSFMEYCLAYGYERIGNLEKAIDQFTQIEKNNPNNGVLARGEIARLRRTQGRIEEAHKLYLSILSEIDSLALDRFLETWYRLRTVEVLIELWRMDEASRLLVTTEQAMSMQNVRNYGVVTSSECFALLAYGYLYFNLDKSEEYLRLAEEDAAGQNIRYPMPIDETKAYLWAREGNQVALSGWAKQTLRKLDEKAPLYVSTITALSLAFLNLGKPKLAMKVALRAKEDAESIGELTYVAQALFLEAIGHDLLDQGDDALSSALLAIETARQVHCIGGIPLTGMLGRRLLSRLIERSDHTAFRITLQQRDYAHRLLKAIDAQLRVEHVSGNRKNPKRSVFRGYADLTEREQEVLSLLTEGLKLEAVAKRMDLSVNTVKTHVKAIYRKLGVHSRKELLSFAGKVV